MEPLSSLNRHNQQPLPAGKPRAVQPLSRLYRARLATPSVWSLAALCAPFLATATQAADASAAAPAPALVKPAWLTDLSLGLREGYDDNIFLGGAKAKDIAGFTPASDGSVEALKNRSSWITTVSPKVGVNFAPLLGDQKVLQVLALGYAPDFITYHDHSSESYNAHRIAATVKGKSDHVSFNLENGFNYINGSKEGPSYPNSLNSAYATAAARERREQYQDRSKFSLQYDQEQWFLRPVASLLYYDLQTDKRATTTAQGYQNYADRYDVNGGLDVGYKLDKNVAVTLGYRYGHQYQEEYSHAIDPFGQSSTSDYQRVLAGVEGKPLNWLTVSVQGGPDFRSYADTAPVHDRHPVKYFGVASLTADITAKDSISFKYQQWQWVSSTGKVPYFDSTYDLSYARKLTDKLSLTLGGRLLTSDYTSGLAYSAANFNPQTAPSNKRDDWFYTLSIGVRYAITPNLSADLAYAYDLGRNNQDNLGNRATGTPVGETREFDHQLVSLGVLFKF